MIVGVAVRHNDKWYTLPKPKRHHDVIKLIFDQTGEPVHADPDFGQGFFDENGKIYNRKGALTHVKAINQPLTARATCAGGRLYSEDVW